MEKILVELINSPDKSLKITEKFIIKRITFRNDIDLIILDLQQNDKVYKGLAMIKGITYPIPKIYDILIVEKIYLKYSEEFELKLFIEGEINPIKEEKIILAVKHNYSFENENIYETLSSIAQLDISKMNTDLFKTININGNIATIKSISNSKIYNLKFELNLSNIFNSKDFLWISCYYLEEDKIEINNLTTFELLNEKRLIHFLDKNLLENISLFQVIDINKGNIILINCKQNIFVLH